MNAFDSPYSLQPLHDTIAVGTIFTSKVITSDFLFNCASDRDSKGTLCYSTFNFAYWGTISAPNSDLFDQENVFLSFEKMPPEICLFGLSISPFFGLDVIKANNFLKQKVKPNDRGRRGMD